MDCLCSCLSSKHGAESYLLSATMPSSLTTAITIRVVPGVVRLLEAVAVLNQERMDRKKGLKVELVEHEKRASIQTTY